MTAVIYARYSSDNQREESIEGQIRECTAYAEKNGITVIKHYIDRAFSAKTDNRPEFQQMIKDSGKKLFDVVLVWKFDRFARNRFDSANYKMILKKNGVHLISVMEPIAEGSQGILVETLLEGMVEYYSAELSEKVIRGQTENALKGKCTGGTGTIGYKIDDDKFYHLDPLTAPLVLEAFQRYDNGDKMVEIVNFLNDKGVRNMLGGKMTHSSVNTMLKNRRYIGELSFRDIVVPDAIPAIVPKDLFDRVQKRLDKNKRAPACGKADEEYLLTTKLFCGKCGALMFGESGTSATGRTYYYYKCANVKRRKGCNKKTVQKDWLEDLVVRETMKLIQDDAVIDKIVQLVMDVQNQENTTIPLLEKQLREVNKKLDNLMKAIEDGLYTRTTKERLEELEIQKDELTAKIADEKLKKPSFNEDFIRFWLMKFRKFDISQKKQRKALTGTANAALGTTLTNVQVAVLDENDQTVFTAQAAPNTAIFSFKSLDSSIRFGELPAGNYTYMVVVTDSQGDNLCFTSDFTVSDGSASSGVYWSVKDTEGTKLLDSIQEVQDAFANATESTLGWFGGLFQ